MDHLCQSRGVHWKHTQMVQPQRCKQHKHTATTETKTYYQQVIGTLIYATVGTRSDIAFSATWLSWYNGDTYKVCKVHTKISLRHKIPQDQVWWGLRCQINQTLRLRLGWKQRWLSLHIRTCFPDCKQCNILGHHNERKGLHFQWGKLDI